MDLVMVKDDVLSKEFCQEIIHMFNRDDRKRPGVTFKGLDSNIKNSDDLIISRLKEWDDMCDRLDVILKECIKHYGQFVSDMFPQPDSFEDTWHTSYQVQKSGHYLWHNDSAVEDNRVRIITFIFYLNTVKEGGETDFHYKQVKPVEGRVVMFPASWEYIHCGRPARDKYIVTGWLSRPVRVKKMLQ
jgi:hypothetical protein